MKNNNNVSYKTRKVYVNNMEHNSRENIVNQIHIYIMATLLILTKVILRKINGILLQVMKNYF